MTVVTVRTTTLSSLYASMYLLYLLVLWPHFGFDMLFVFVRTAIRAAGGFQATACQKGGCSTSSYYRYFRPYFIYCICRSQATFILEESSQTILLFVDSGGSEVGHVPLDVRND